MLLTLKYHLRTNKIILKQAFWGVMLTSTLILNQSPSIIDNLRMQTQALCLSPRVSVPPCHSLT